MITVPKSAATSNSKSLSEQVNEIESCYLGCPTVEEIKSEIAKKEEDRVTTTKPFVAARIAAELIKCRIALRMAECYRSAIELLKPQFLADQLKQDYDFVLIQLAEAVEAATVNDTLPDEVQIEIQGDVIIPSAELDNCRVEFERMDEGEAVYSVHCL